MEHGIDENLSPETILENVIGVSAMKVQRANAQYLQNVSLALKGTRNLKICNFTSNDNNNMTQSVLLLYLKQVVAL